MKLIVLFALDWRRMGVLMEVESLLQPHCIHITIVLSSFPYSNGDTAFPTFTNVKAGVCLGFG